MTTIPMDGGFFGMVLFVFACRKRTFHSGSARSVEQGVAGSIRAINDIGDDLKLI